ncbi:flagellar filament capping protein FliD [Clostridium botulinum]|uniref:Flagellar hook-associated protein 2 n=1 Tax=Clostridium botulinum (strain Langeland / NCTC 10281 / Type F) TaxID=441772 RepID=A7GGV1_CLOBL|nr:flagellar filament capping protein FliD [Clostridium botulinum]ABS42712.1 Flagellar hook-associated protein 2 [Clostridium botulinum F str. Langeland]ADG00404.1 Flagellar hook-associated protein 2 [Clostridium botulinum F str. 230613]KKM41105.1 flagellar hook protein FliD [Clostridium botulinum]MBY6792655.1 flagellar filament capping protein FliD [Clostridium botulinum]MBY6937702.1 flagellar filament capping protein FliD [Clostridium botulinum]
MRIGGLSGLDTDNMIKNMMKPYTMRVDKMKQNAQIVKWQQDAYRSVISGISDMTKKYFDVLNGDNYMLSSKNFSSLKPSGIPDTSTIKINTGSGAVSGNYSLKVIELASKAEAISDKAINIKTLSEGDYGIKIDSSNNKIVIDSKEITLSKSRYNNASDIAAEINSKINEDGSGLKDTVKAVVKKDGSIKIENLFKIDDANKELKVTVDGKEYTAELTKGNFTLEELTDSINSKLKVAKDADGNVLAEDKGVKASLSTDGKSIEFAGTTAQPNYSVAGVNLGGTTGGTGITGTDVTVADNSITYANEIIEGFNDTFNIQIGTDSLKQVKLAAGTINSLADLETKLNDAFDAAGLKPTLTATVKDERIVLSSNSDKQVIITGESGKSATSLLGLSDRYEMSMSTNEKMSNIVNEVVEFEINGVNFKYDFTSTGAEKDKTISQILADISDKANVETSYSEITKSFVLRSKEEGATQNIKCEDKSGSFVSSILGSNTTAKGKDAKIELKTPNNSTATTIIKPSNNFTIDGVNYNIAGAKKDEEISFSLDGNVEDSFNKIKGFIDDYNKLIDELQKKTSEKKYRKYEPLTEEQKKDMKENDIKLWEEKAKSGILRNDSNIENMLSTLRRAFFDSVEGAGLSLKELGLTTSKDYQEGGKIVFDQTLDKNGNNGEARLKKLLKEEPDKVFKIFSQESTSYPSYSADLTLTERQVRNKEEGIFQRINDIFKDYTRTSRSASGKRGILVDKAGIEGTVSEIDNILYKDLEKREKAIQDMELKLIERENKYYIQFAQMEKYINQANSQASWLAQQLGGGMS